MLNLSFGNLEFGHKQESSRFKKGGGIRDLHKQLRVAQSRKSQMNEALRDRSVADQEAIAHRQSYLFESAIAKAKGVKVKDDPTRLSKALAKRRNQKRRSAKKWKERIDAFDKSVEQSIEDAVGGGGGGEDGGGGAGAAGTRRTRRGKDGGGKGAVGKKGKGKEKGGKGGKGGKGKGGFAGKGRDAKGHNAKSAGGKGSKFKGGKGGKQQKGKGGGGKKGKGGGGGKKGKGKFS